MRTPTRLLAFALLAGSSPASAETCKVRVLRAPEEVKPVLESWVRGELNCRGDLEVRVVATEGGYYLYARDSAGRVRERVVPDAQAVGVLVASWIADDATPAAPALAPPHTVQPRQLERNEPGGPRGSMQPDGVAFTVGAITSLAKGYGMRAEVEIAHRGWLVYGAASLGRTGMVYADGGGSITLYPTDARLGVGVGHGWGGARWNVRARIGVMHAKWTGDFGDMTTQTRFNGVETGLRVSRRLTQRWSFVGGLDVTTIVNQLSSVGTVEVVGPGLEIGVLGGLDVRL